MLKGEGSDGQLWWDLGVIIYRLASGNICPFESKSKNCIKKLILKYPVTFPNNLPRTVSEPL